MKRSVPVLVALLAAVAAADRIELKDGRVLEGAVIAATTDVIVVLRPWGELRLPRSEVASIVAAENELTRYRDRDRLVADSDVPALEALLLHCEKAELSGALERTARRLLAVDPHHRVAHEVLGHESIDGEWFTAAAARRRRAGDERDANGDEVVARAAAVARARALRALERRINDATRRLFSTSDAKARVARAELMGIARDERMGELARFASEWYDKSVEWRGSGGGTIVEVRADLATVTAMRERSVNLGGGAGSVRLQLPELRRTSIRTTVGFP